MEGYETIGNEDIKFNNCSLDVLFKFVLNNLEYYEHINDPIFQCLSNFEQLDKLIQFNQTKAVMFFFFVEKL